MGLFSKGWLSSSDDDSLRTRKREIESDTDWESGSILDGDFDEEIKAIDAIDEELNQRAWDRYNVNVKPRALDS